MTTNFGGYVDLQRWCETIAGGHTYHDTAVCVVCDLQLRCICGRFIRADQLEAHDSDCPTLGKMIELEARE